MQTLCLECLKVVRGEEGSDKDQETGRSPSVAAASERSTRQRRMRMAHAARRVWLYVVCECERVDVRAFYICFVSTAHPLRKLFSYTGSHERRCVIGVCVCDR
jgi:hypothetical protein